MKRKWLIRIIFFGFIFLLFTVIGLLVAELIFRQSNRYPLAAFQLSNNDLWRPRKNLEVNKKNAEGTPFKLKTDCNGFRGSTEKKKKAKNIKRILVLGDSYTAGLDYPFEQIFTTVFSNLLAGDSSLNTKFEVINTGVPAWGIDQEWRYFINQGITLQPDYVILVASPNDIREAYCKKFVTAASNDSVVAHEPHFSVTKRLGWYLSSRSAFFQYLETKVFYSNYGTIFDAFEMYPVNFGTEDANDWDRPLYLRQPFQEVTDAYDLYGRLLNAIRIRCARENIEFGVALIPAQSNYTNVYGSDSLCMVNTVDDFFSGITHQQGIPFRDLNEKAKQLQDPLSLYMINDSHLGSKGHLFAGQELYEFFKGNMMKSP